MRIEVSSPVIETPRVLQVRGLFDLPAAKHSGHAWDVELPLEERAWQIGLVVGPSGCGKSTIARRLWPEAWSYSQQLRWDPWVSVLDAFPATMPVKDLVVLLSSVGFSSPPAWLRPFPVLSTGQQFRVTLARLLAERPELAVLDEFTSVVDRTVAQVGSAALAKTVRARGLKFIAVTCHEDVEAWLGPDWVYRPAENHFAWRSLQPRPAIRLTVARVQATAWQLFRDHHYLTSSINKSAVCFAAWWQEQPVAFSAWLPFVGTRIPTRREHRTVTLPDYQGVGIGHALSTFVGSLYRCLGYRATSTTTHPAFIASRRRDPNWRLRRPPSLSTGRDGNPRIKHASSRLTAGFEYVGPAMDLTTARALYGKGEERAQV